MYLLSYLSPRSIERKEVELLQRKGIGRPYLERQSGGVEPGEVGSEYVTSSGGRYAGARPERLSEGG